MNIHAFAVVGHVGPDVRGGAMDAPHALAALAALGQPNSLVDIPPAGSEGTGVGFPQALSPRLLAVRTTPSPPT